MLAFYFLIVFSIFYFGCLLIRELLGRIFLIEKLSWLSNIGDDNFLASAAKLLLASFLCVSVERSLILPTFFQMRVDLWKPRWILFFSCLRLVSMILPMGFLVGALWGVSHWEGFYGISSPLETFSGSDLFYFLSNRGYAQYASLIFVVLIGVAIVKRPFLFWGPTLLGLLTFQISVSNAWIIFWAESFGLGLLFFTSLPKGNWFRRDFKFLLGMQLLLLLAFVCFPSHVRLAAEIAASALGDGSSLVLQFLTLIAAWVALETILSLIFFHFYFNHHAQSRESLFLPRPQWIRWGWIRGGSRENLVTQISQKIERMSVQQNQIHQSLTVEEQKRIPAYIVKQFKTELKLLLELQQASKIK